MKPYLIIKRILDFIFALISLLVTTPLLIIVAILIKIESNGPILFRQKRPGKNEKIFEIYKFRSMRVETHLNGKPLTDIERMTRVGAFIRRASIDELPQLINILRGEMSFIGPRPLLVEYLEFYNTDQKKRHLVMPGITGLAQVNGRNNIEWEEKFKYDICYVYNISFLLDFKILLLTVYKVINRKDINKNDNITMPSFKGSTNTSV